MNERICKIAQETDAWCDQRYLGEDSYDIEWEAKFAELIVQECISVIDSLANSDDSDDYFWTVRLTSSKLKEHFGVTE